MLPFVPTKKIYNLYRFVKFLFGLFLAIFARESFSVMIYFLEDWDFLLVVTEVFLLVERVFASLQDQALGFVTEVEVFALVVAAVRVVYFW